MSDFGDTWRLTRGRFDAVFDGVNTEQLNYRLQPDSLTLGEMGLHVAGVEVFFLTQLLNEQPEGDRAKLAAAATDGVVNENRFPFAAEEIDPDKVAWALTEGRKLVERWIDELPDDMRAKNIKSALGPIVDGTGAFARLAYHAGYHQGQAHLIKTSAGYPR